MAGMALSTATQRTLLKGFIVSIALSGLVGIYALLAGGGSLEFRILSSTATFGGASILCLAAAIAWETDRWRAIALPGMIAPALALLLFWIEIWNLAPRISNYAFERSLGSACVLAVAFPHVALLGLARLHRGYEWVRYGAAASIGLLSALILAEIWYEPNLPDLWRLNGVLGILVACGTIATPVLHRVSGIRGREQVVTTELQLSLTCPRCSKTQMVAAGRSRCSCGLKFRVEIEEEHCPRCGYSLYRATSGRCPECGAAIEDAPSVPA